MTEQDVRHLLKGARLIELGGLEPAIEAFREAYPEARLVGEGRRGADFGYIAGRIGATFVIVFEGTNTLSQATELLGTSVVRFDTQYRFSAMRAIWDGYDGARSILLREIGQGANHVILIGHSAGGAAAIQLGATLAALNFSGRVDVLTIGSPKCVDSRGVRLLSRWNNVHFANVGDPVPLVPPSVADLDAGGPSAVALQLTIAGIVGEYYANRNAWDSYAQIPRIFLTVFGQQVDGSGLNLFNYFYDVKNHYTTAYIRTIELWLNGGETPGGRQMFAQTYGGIRAQQWLDAFIAEDPARRGGPAAVAIQAAINNSSDAAAFGFELIRLRDNYVALSSRGAGLLRDSTISPGTFDDLLGYINLPNTFAGQVASEVARSVRLSPTASQAELFETVRLTQARVDSLTQQVDSLRAELRALGQPGRIAAENEDRRLAEIRANQARARNAYLYPPQPAPNPALYDPYGQPLFVGPPRPYDFRNATGGTVEPLLSSAQPAGQSPMSIPIPQPVAVLPSPITDAVIAEQPEFGPVTGPQYPIDYVPAPEPPVRVGRGGRR